VRLESGGVAKLIGMVHLLPLPGSAGWLGDRRAVLTAARRDADRLLEGGCDALLVENMHDAPYLRGAVGPETVAAMAVVVHALVELGAPVGVQVLAAANKEALGVAVAAGASFVRVEGFAYAHVADEGWIDGLRWRAAAVAARARRRRADLGGRAEEARRARGHGRPRAWRSSRTARRSAGRMRW
jgi:membrane complex biogenesis BtpA family protein